jgi:protoporphyrinogen oxidase
LSAAWTLKKHGVEPILFEANARVGGRLDGDNVSGFSLDTGADFFCSSYDVAFRLCDELGLSLLRSKMKLGWYRNGRWVTTKPGLSAGNLIRNLPAARALGFLSPRVMWSVQRLFREILRQSEYLNFASDSRIAELDGEENFGDYLKRLGVSESLQTTFKGFLEMTMGDVEFSGQAYMRAYLMEMLVKADKLYVPEKGAGALSHALAEACRDFIRVSTPVRRVVIQNGTVTSVIGDDGPVEADAVICAVSATKVPEIIPDLSSDIRHALGKVTYSTGVRVVIGLDHPPLPSGWHGVLYPEDDTPLLLDRSINLTACAPPGKSTLDLLVGRDRAESLLPLDDEEIKRQMLREARRNPPPGSRLPGDDEGLFTRVYRWKEAVCMGQPGMFRAVAEMRRKLNRDVKNLFLAGDYMRVPSVNGALASGIDAASEVVALLKSRESGAVP